MSRSFLGRSFLGRSFLGRSFWGRSFLGRSFLGWSFLELIFLGLVFLALYPCGKKSSIRSQFNQKYVKINSIFYKIVSYGEKIFFQIPKSEKNWDLEEQKSYWETISFSESLPATCPAKNGEFPDRELRTHRAENGKSARRRIENFLGRNPRPYHSLKLIFRSTSPLMPSTVPLSVYCQTAYS